MQVRDPQIGEVRSRADPEPCGTLTERDERGSLRGDTWGARDADSPDGPLGPRVSHRR
ncbi:hypothetical protein KDN32_07745 [Nocardioides sp. J2M5]|uniref:hypothetical protein n=1 Tax=Nocardioides palaemonis TaxID=2829810 RepID=UPI001BAB5A44|nr:hypothetical protein [Nocardioides palaemonis]MBS2937632.1 hypothetical protein [Nocardioides palaemonis]